VSPLVALLCLLAGSALPVVAFWALARRGIRQLAVSTAYGDVARQLGLDVDTRGVSLQGHLGEQRLWVGEVLVGHGPQRRMVCWGVLDHERPLGLGLVIQRRARVDRWFRRRAKAQLNVDRLAGWDRRLEVGGDDPELVGQLLDEPVRAAIRALTARWSEVVVTDQSVRVYLSQPPGRAETLRALVDHMRAVANALATARRALPPPGPLRDTMNAWARAGEELGLDLEPAFPGLAGTLGGRSVRLTPVRHEDGYANELRIAFQAHAPTGLRVRRQLGPDGYWSVGQDIQTGDELFDRSFVLKGYDPEAIRERMSPEIREALVRLNALGEVDVDDLRLYTGRLPADPAELAPIVRLALEVADGLGW
jgi:hypothetical protein